MTVSSLIYVFAGGGLGCVARYSVSQYVSSSTAGFPIATFVSNFAACLLLGGLLAWQAKTDMETQHALLLMTGFCGGFSTFSTFSAETLSLLQDGQAGMALSYVGVSVFLGLVAIYIGFRLITSWI